MMNDGYQATYIKTDRYALALQKLLTAVAARPDTIPRRAELLFREAERELRAELTRLGQPGPVDLKGL